MQIGGCYMNKGEEILNICWDTFQKKMCLESFFLKQNLKEYKPSEIHCIQYVGDNPNTGMSMYKIVKFIW